MRYVAENNYGNVIFQEKKNNYVNVTNDIM